MATKLRRIVIIKPTHYGPEGFATKFWYPFMPSPAPAFMKSRVSSYLQLRDLKRDIEVVTVDECAHTDLRYMKSLKSKYVGETLVLVVSAQSMQFHRALDLANIAANNKSLSIIGGPHTMVCDTSMLHGRGISFALAEAELILAQILDDALQGFLHPVYGEGQRWAPNLDDIITEPPTPWELKRYLLPMVGLYPARGCIFNCHFCSVIHITGRKIRSQSVEIIVENLRMMDQARVRWVFITSDDLNHLPQFRELLETIIQARLKIGFMCTCDVTLSNNPELIELMSKAGCFQIFFGVESLNPRDLKSIHKGQNLFKGKNLLETYVALIKACHSVGISVHFANMIGFPDQTRADILEHARMVRELKPDVISWYMMCPIPGSRQYQQYRDNGLLVEPNLDMYDTISLTWRHPKIPRNELQELLWRCGSETYRPSDMMRRVRNEFHKEGLKAAAEKAIFELYCTYSWRNQTHPMAGGLGKVNLDHVSQYIRAREERFGYELVPLPNNRPLPTETRQLVQVATSA